jgi:hypothetical protein
VTRWRMLRSRVDVRKMKCRGCWRGSESIIYSKYSTDLSYAYAKNAMECKKGIVQRACVI